MTSETTALVKDGSGAMFDGIAARYDLVNRVISLGIDQSWRKKTVRALKLAADHQVLDLATGTADLAIQVAETMPSVRVTGLDPSAKMLEVGRQKVTRAKLSERVELVQGDAQALPFAANTFDSVCIAFGIRNVPNRAAALREMARVTRPGGRIAILELSEPRSGLLGAFARFHIHTVVPYVGALLSGVKEYQYLQRSIAAFPPAEEFAALMQSSNLNLVALHPLTFGVCHLYVAEPGNPA
ncbi:MAG TPA: bifunctional demethylmenaquinone methyltransferase/2-methoxy-6-polyprenyl-1,4-benzoquinol methylase UbiE [Polyangiaceae bacterium]|jgi:demethylmenaquinone methyltransferase/2-methoxy-6-polyprenyl-1,4-benzoquinol methylase|nr:bifunctional demethylmenaquinone methyltransferase/2-methoxy-6-polyprenyl-1,4-benzoquinol methylase UbiE [Polyangiaceae bacterium]